MGSYYTFNGKHQREYDLMMTAAREGKWLFSQAACDAMKTYYRCFINGNLPDRYKGKRADYKALCESIADTFISIEWKRFKANENGGM